MSGFMTGDPTSDKRIRNASQRVDDTQHRIEMAQARIDEMNVKGTATARSRAEAEHALAVAKREHADAQIDLQTAIDKSQAGGKDKAAGGGPGEQLGQDIFSGIGEIFGMGDLFKDPTQFGLFKIFKAVMGLKFNDQGTATGGDGASLFPGGGGGGGGGGPLGAIMGLIQPFGQLNLGSPGNAPGEFMPQLGTGGGGTGGIVPPGGVIADPNSPPGVAGPGNPQPGNVNDFRGANFGYSPTAVQDQVNSAHLQSTRQPMRALPS